MITHIDIIDYGFGNLDSVARAIEECGGKPRVTTDPKFLETADRIILPGVGAFPDAVDTIRRQGWDEALENTVLKEGVPLLGICLGMHVLADEGHEGATTRGLGLIPGSVRKLSPLSDERVPHVGWNEVVFDNPCPLLKDIESGRDFYFVHSYHFECSDDADRLATTPYCGNFASVIGRDCIFGVQFHPEKSQQSGFQILRNFLAL